MSKVETPLETSAGVEALIAKLRDDGVESGRREAQKILADAQQRSDWLLRQAQEEAEKILADARREAQELRRTGLEALQVAARDAALTLQDKLRHRFDDEVRSLVSDSLLEPSALLSLLQAVVMEACRDMGLELSGEITCHLPETLAIDEATLNQMVLGVSRELLTRGVSLTLLPHSGRGLRLQLHDNGMEIDLSQETLCELLLEHLQPKVRNLLQGVFRE